MPLDIWLGLALAALILCLIVVGIKMSRPTDRDDDTPSGTAA